MKNKSFVGRKGILILLSGIFDKKTTLREVKVELAEHYPIIKAALETTLFSWAEVAKWDCVKKKFKEDRSTEGIRSDLASYFSVIKKAWEKNNKV